MKKNLLRIIALALIVSLFCLSAFAVSDEEFEEVKKQRDILYQQLLDNKIEPAIKLENKGAEPAKEEANKEEPQKDEKVEEQKAEEKKSEEDKPADKGSKKLELEGVEVAEEYLFTKKHFEGKVYVAVIKNNSDSTKDVALSVIFLKDKEVVGVSKQSENAVAPGHETVLEFYQKEDFDDIQLKIEVRNDDYLVSAQPQVETKAKLVSNKLIISCTNKGEKTVQSVRISILLFDKEGRLMDVKFGYVGDSNGEITAGETEHNEVRLNMKDEELAQLGEYKVYTNGRVKDK